MNISRLLFSISALLLPSSFVIAAETITGFIFCDNYFEFWFNGDLIVKDPAIFTPHQAVEVSFEWDEKSDKVYSIMCQDYMNDEYETGFEYVEVPLYIDGQCCFLNSNSLKFDNCTTTEADACPTSCPPNIGTGFWELPGGMAPSDRCDADGNCRGCGPWIGDGNLLAEFSDGTRTTKDWKVFTTTFGPNDESILNGCSYKDFSACQVDVAPAPDAWQGVDFDDSSWIQSTEFTVAEAGWGRTPFYNETTGECCGVTGQNRKPAAQPCIVLPKDQCLNPKNVLCDRSGGAECPGPMCTSDGPQCDGEQDGRVIWESDLQRAQQNLFRYVVPFVSNNGSSSGTNIA